MIPLNFIYFIHKNIPSKGYQKLLASLQYDKIYSFNWSYFFFSGLWLIHHKMYVHYFLILLVYLSISFYTYENNIDINNIVFLSLIIHIIFTLFSFYLYYLHLENKFHKTKYDPEKCLKIATPHPWYIQILLNITIPLLFSIITTK